MFQVVVICLDRSITNYSKRQIYNFHKAHKSIERSFHVLQILYHTTWFRKSKFLLKKSLCLIKTFSYWEHFFQIVNFSTKLTKSDSLQYSGADYENKKSFIIWYIVYLSFLYFQVHWKQKSETWNNSKSFVKVTDKWDLWDLWEFSLSNLDFKRRNWQLLWKQNFMHFLKQIVLKQTSWYCRGRYKSSVTYRGSEYSSKNLCCWKVQLTPVEFFTKLYNVKVISILCDSHCIEYH